VSLRDGIGWEIGFGRNRRNLSARLRLAGVDPYLPFKLLPIKGGTAHDAGFAGRFGEWDKSAPLLPFAVAPVRQEGARSDRS